MPLVEGLPSNIFNLLGVFYNNFGTPSIILKITRGDVDFIKLHIWKLKAFF